MAISITYHLSFKYQGTQTLAQIKSQEFIGHVKQNFMNLTYVTNGIHNFVKCYEIPMAH